MSNCHCDQHYHDMEERYEQEEDDRWRAYMDELKSETAENSNTIAAEEAAYDQTLQEMREAEERRRWAEVEEREADRLKIEMAYVAALEAQAALDRLECNRGDICEISDAEEKSYHLWCVYNQLDMDTEEKWIERKFDGPDVDNAHKELQDDEEADWGDKEATLRELSDKELMAQISRDEEIQRELGW